MDLFKPVQMLADAFTSHWLGISGHWGEALNFFIYDAIKIGLLLVIINYLMAIIRFYFPMEKVRDLLTARRWYGLDYLLAAGLGAVTPFCSCSSIPLFIGFLGAGIPLGITFTFLISSPLVNESSLFLFPALLGVRTTIIYNLVGIVISILGGMVIEKLKLERFVNEDLLKFKNRQVLMEENGGKDPSFGEKVRLWWANGMAITRKIFPYMLLGVGVGAVIHGVIPQQFVERYLGTRAWWSVAAATLLGAPLYANSVSVIPVIEALIGKGVSLGTALAFMTATVTLSIPEALILKKAMRWPLLLAFFSITIIGIMVIGFVFNF